MNQENSLNGFELILSHLYIPRSSIHSSIQDLERGETMDERIKREKAICSFKFICFNKYDGLLPNDILKSYQPYYDGVAYFWYDGLLRRWKFTIHKFEHSEVDCLLIAITYGGEGDENYGEFTISNIEPLLNKNKSFNKDVAKQHILNDEGLHLKLHYPDFKGWADIQIKE